MSDELDDKFDQDESEEDQAKQVARIARPVASPASAVPVTARGIGAPALGAPAAAAAPAALGSTEDLESRGLADHMTPPPIAKPTPLQTRKSADETELGRLQSTGSGISQIKNPVGRGIARTLDTIGNIVAPRITQEIPGTELHHSELLGQAQGRLGRDEAEETQQAAIGKTNADTDEAEARGDLANAGAAKDRSEVTLAGQPKPKEEEWTVVPGMVGPKGQLVQQEKNSGQIRFAPDISGVGPVKPPADKPDTPEQQFIDEFQRTNPKATVAQAIAAYANATQKPEKQQRQLAVINGKVVELTPGMDATGAQSIGGEEKAQTGKQSAEDALNYAKDYLAGANFTGAGDEALLEKYFELAKPSSGFRMTQAQIELLQHARDLMGGVEAKAKHLFSPNAPYFSDEQRKQIVDTMSQLQTSKGGTGGASAATSNPPKGATHIVQGKDGKNHYTNDAGTVDLGVAP